MSRDNIIKQLITQPAYYTIRPAKKEIVPINT